MLMVYVFAAIVISQILIARGLAAPVIEPPSEPAPPPAQEGGFFDQVRAILESVVLPFRYMINSIGAFFQLMTFQITEIPTLINTIMVTPFWFGILLLAFRLIRGGG
jgi:hypothetical protein